MISSRFVHLLVAFVLFALRTWSMFYLMRMVNTGRFTVELECLFLCIASCIQFLCMCLLAELSLVLSFTDNRYSEHSVFYYWKSILLCGTIKAVQVYLWISALSSCGPFIYVLFEQSPKLIFVIFGLLSNSYSSNRRAIVSA